MYSYKCKVFSIMVLAFAVTVTLASCDMGIDDFDDLDEIFEDQYTLIINHEGRGETTPSKGKHDKDEDDVVYITVYPEDGWEFVEWVGPDGDEVTENDSYQIIMDEDKEITAVFSLKTNVINTFRHENEERVWSVEFSSDDRKVVSGGDDTIKIKDPINGDVILTFTEHDRASSRVTFSSDDSMVASFAGKLGVGGTTKIWETDTGMVISEFVHEDIINSLAFSPDDSMVAFGGREQPLKIGDPRKGTTKEIFSEEDVSVASVAFTSDNEYVIAGLSDQTVKIWKIETGEIVTNFTGHNETVEALDVSSDDNHIVSVALGDGIKVWNIDTEEVITTYDEQGIVQSVVFSGDDRKVISASWDNTVKVWDRDTGETLIDFTEHETNVFSVDISSDDSMIVSGDGIGFIKVWELGE